MKLRKQRENRDRESRLDTKRLKWFILKNCFNTESNSKTDRENDLKIDKFKANKRRRDFA